MRNCSRVTGAAGLLTWLASSRASGLPLGEPGGGFCAAGAWDDEPATARRRPWPKAERVRSCRVHSARLRSSRLHDFGVDAYHEDLIPFSGTSPEPLRYRDPSRGSSSRSSNEAIAPSSPMSCRLASSSISPSNLWHSCCRHYAETEMPRVQTRLNTGNNPCAPTKCRGPCRVDDSRVAASHRGAMMAPSLQHDVTGTV